MSLLTRRKGYYNIVSTGGSVGIVKKLTKIGNSYGVIFPKDYLEEMGLDEGVEMEMERRGNELVVKPLRLKDYKIMKTFLSVVRDYDPVLKRLAKSK